MLKFRRKAAATVPQESGSLLERPDLRIGNLLDDPRLRRSMGLPVGAPEAPRFDRRRLLEQAAA